MRYTVCFFGLNLLSFSVKFPKTEYADLFKCGGHYPAEYQQKSLATKRRISNFASFLLHICVGCICELFKPKTSVSKPNSQLMFKEFQKSPTFHGFRIDFTMRYNFERLEI